MVNAAIIAVVCLAAAVLFHPRIARARRWRATITPLASIIGSGFLVIGPILVFSFGAAAPVMMAALCLAAWFFGSAIRFNIACIDGKTGRTRMTERLETLASAVLAFAYIISVAYYLNLFGAFAVNLTPFNDAFHAKLMTTAIFALIFSVGWSRGFLALERLEMVSVSIKLAIIAGLLLGLAFHFTAAAERQALLWNPATVTGWPAATLAFGLIVTVQGFETTRYLGDAYDARTRIASMRFSQMAASLIYMVYILLLAYVFAPGSFDLHETAIIDMMEQVAPVLPALLVAAALAAQFSAAVADTSGSGGLIEEVTGGRISIRLGYALLVAVGVLLTWTMDVFEIISFASRAFAAFYSAQSAIATVSAWSMRRYGRASFFALLAVLGAAMFLFGVPAE